MYCSACGKGNAPHSRFCCACGGELGPAGRQNDAACPRCAGALDMSDRFCPQCGFLTEATPQSAAAFPPPEQLLDVIPRKGPAAQSRPGPRPGRQSPLLALCLGFLLPGAGQAYNGQPIKGFFLFFASVLAAPYLFSLYDAYATAARIRGAGMSSGWSGFFWVFLQFWLAVNTALLVVLVLTYMGVLT